MAAKPNRDDLSGPAQVIALHQRRKAISSSLRVFIQQGSPLPQPLQRGGAQRPQADNTCTGVSLDLHLRALKSAIGLAGSRTA